MSRFQKIFLASALVVVGFGVAKFLGQPVSPAQVLNSRSGLPRSFSVAAQFPAETAGSAQAAGRVRLLPDSPMSYAGAPATSSNTAKPEPPRLGNTLAPLLATSDRANHSTMLRNVDSGPISPAPIGETASPRARLRNEAPRPVGVDPQSPAVIRRLPSENGEVSDPYKTVETKAAPSTASPAASSAPQLLNIGYTEISRSPPIAMPASYAAPVNSVPQNLVSPPPWPVPEEAVESRTHIVIDGDSLERLASRYLSDPQRGREIYELNREILSAPDLLPIGAELKIPERVASASWDRRGFQPNAANAGLYRDVDRENVTPVRPATSPQGIIPRAQLAAPVMVQ